MHGAEAAWMSARNEPSFSGPDANMTMEYGAGIAVRPGLVLTAKHIVWGSEVVFVVPEGAADALAARVVYADPVADFAFLAVDGHLAHVVPLPSHAVPPPIGADLWVSGFPVDPMERTPAVARSTLSRVMEDGRLQLQAEVNPGNSGGPVFDARGTLLGIVVERGDPAQGVQGIATAEPIALAVAAYAREVSRAPASTFDGVQRALAVATTRALSTGPVATTTELEAVVAAVDEHTPPAERMVAALAAWGVARHRLSAARTNDVATLTPEQRATIDPFLAKAVELARRALDDGPYLRNGFSFGVMLLRTNGDPAQLALRIPHAQP